MSNGKIESFPHRFGKSHFLFAYHTAFLIALTPDSLYCLWANFKRDIQGKVLEIPWIAVSDLLFYSLVDKVDYEIYEIDVKVRQIILRSLQEEDNFGQKRIKQLSDFLLVYIQKQLKSENPLKNGPH